MPVRIGRIEITDAGEVQRLFSGISKREVGKTVLHGIMRTEGIRVTTQMVVPFSRDYAERGDFSADYSSPEEAKRVAYEEDLTGAHIALAIARFLGSEGVNGLTLERLEDI